MKRLKRALAMGLLAPALHSIAGCGEPWANLTASFGGDRAGDRGTLRVLFINNTPEHAVFTLGTYDQTNQNSQPDFEQFGINPSDRPLPGDSTADYLSIDCGRVFSLGSPELLRLIEDNLPDAALIDEAFVQGVEFHQIPAEDDPAADPTLSGTAPPFEALLGVDFPCNSLLIIRFEIDDLGPSPYRIDFEFIPSESTR